MNIVFIGASNFGLKCLQTIYRDKDTHISGVITAPKKFTISYSKELVTNVLHADIDDFCKENNILYYSMQKNMHEENLINCIKAWKPDLILVVGWYHMIPREVRMIPRKGVVGFHSSHLPLYRGGAPLVWAIMNGEKSVGVSLFFLEDGVDTGDIIAQESISVKMRDTIATVYKKIEDKGIAILQTTFKEFLLGKIIPRKQMLLDTLPTQWGQRSPIDGRINWNQMSPIGLYNFIRAQTMPYPGAFTYLNNDKITIWKAMLYPYEYEGEIAGTIIKLVKTEDVCGVLVSTENNDIPIIITEVSVNDKLLTETSMMEYFLCVYSMEQPCVFK